MQTSLSLIVIRSANIEAALNFYRALGLDFEQEQHGSGPIHYSCALGETVLEIYPGQAGAPVDPKSSGATMLGFKVASLDGTLKTLQAQGIEPKSAPKDAPWGRWVNVSDPDGRAVQLGEAPQRETPA